MKKQYVIVEHRNSAAFIRLKEQVIEYKAALEALNKRYKDLEMQYGNEVYFNNALCDLLRNNGIPYRQIFSHEYRAGLF